MTNREKKKLYLVTGFLGAGKTTLMKELINIFNDKKIGVIINEFGKQGIDGTLLKKEGLKITEINNGSIFCVCRSDLFIDALIEALKIDIDILLVETSGLSDPTGMDKILDTVTKVSNDQFDYKGAIAVVDATNFLKLMHTAVAVPQQIVSSHLILINKTDLANEEIIKQIEEEIHRINPKAMIRTTTFSSIEDPTWITCLDAAPKMDFNSLIKKRTLGTQKFLLKIKDVYSKKEIEQWICDFYDAIYRIKGFVKLIEGWHYVDGIGGKVSIYPTNIAQEQSFLVVLASGDKPVKSIITESWNRYFTEQLKID
ncbi:MAG: hypothetical protein PWP27_2113 [Clostridiales bacterium]|jgi:G3E family GTPase|nr:hypothetical protein [Clostridiales bacterium]MDK2934303.1 hypothetical protein [Clostridiales bacterium]